MTIINSSTLKYVRSVSCNSKKFPSDANYGTSILLNQKWQNLF